MGLKMNAMGLVGMMSLHPRAFAINENPKA